MLPFVPSLLLVLLLAAPALPTPSASQELQVRGQRTPRDTRPDAIKVVISEGCSTQGDSSDVSQGGKEVDLTPGSPLVLTHKIKLLPLGLPPGSGSCGCETDFAALRERLERLEREVSSLREGCGGAEGGCCTSKESKGAGCSIKPEIAECPNECSDQGRCVDGKCACFPGFSGPDCSRSNCPGNCNDHGRCVDGQCVCDPGFTGSDCSQQACPDGFTGPDCSQRACPEGFTGPDCSQQTCPNGCTGRGKCVDGQCVCDPGFTGPDCLQQTCPEGCTGRGKCVDGQCVCDPGFTGSDCSDEMCPGNCNGRGRCVNGQCVCNPGFDGPDCSKRACPNNCSDRGRCVDGKCVCDSGSTGDDCSENSCPGNCNDRGRCVNGECVCDDGFTGADCWENSCPENCSNRGRCVDGECVCEDGFSAPDCSEKTCPKDCFDRGRCVDGKCECDSGFTGDDCSENSCPGNCSDRGRCVNGECVCDDGFTGADCSEKACPKNCSKRGKCVNGKCVCSLGFAGPDCAAKSCPNNCSNKGRCAKGRCVCRRGFTGPDCSQCEEGRTGPNCDVVMAGVSQLSTRDVTETSVTLVWTPPPVQYETYHITFTSQKESDQQITAQVDGSLNAFTQTGLAAGQEFTASVRGETNGRMGAESSTEFRTLTPGPTSLQVVKTTTTSAVVQWEQSQGEIDRYRLTVTPNDGAGGSREMTVPFGQNSAHIEELQAGRLYDVVLVAEKGASQSEPTATQVTPGKTLPEASLAAFSTQIRLEPGPGVGGRDQLPEVHVSDQQERKTHGSEADSVKLVGIGGPNKDSVIGRTKPLVSRNATINGTRPRFSERPVLSKKPKSLSPFRFNTARLVSGARKVGLGTLKKPPVGEKKKAPIVPKNLKPGVPTSRYRTMAWIWRDPSVEASSTERRNAQTPAPRSGTDPDINRQRSITVGSKEQPDVGRAADGNGPVPVSPELTGRAQTQKKKCMNKLKVTHIRFPLMARGDGCRRDGTVLVRKTTGSHQGSTETEDGPDLKPSSAETDLDYSPDPLHKLLTDTFDSLNVTSFSVHLASDHSELSAESERVRALKPSSSFSSSTSQSSSPTTAAPLASQAHSPPSLQHSILDKLGSGESKEPDADSSNSVASPGVRKPPPSGKGTVIFRRAPAKPGFILHPRSNLFKNRSRLHQHSHPRVNDIPGRSPYSSASDESSSVADGSVSVRGISEHQDGATTPASSKVEQHKKKMPTGRGPIPVHHLPLKNRYILRPVPNLGPLQKRTHPYMKQLPAPFKPSNPASDTRNKQASPTGLPGTSSSRLSQEYNLAEGTGPREEENEDMVATSAPSQISQTLKGRRVSSSYWPTSKAGYFRPQQLYGGRSPNKTQTNLKSPRHPKVYVRKPFPMRNGGSDPTVRSQTHHLEKVNTTEIQDNQSGEPGAPMTTQGEQSGQSGEQDNVEIFPNAQTESHNSSIRQEPNRLEGEDSVQVQTTKSGTEETQTPDSKPDFNVHEEQVDAGKNTGGRVRPTTKQTSKLPRPVSLPKRQPAARPQTSPSISGSQRLFDSKTEPIRSTNSKPMMGSDVSSSGATREFLENVRVTNRTSRGFALTWDSPHGKYKNFVVTGKEVGKNEGPKPESRKDHKEVQEAGRKPAQEAASEHGSSEDENPAPESAFTQVPGIPGGPTADLEPGRDKPFKKVLPGSARSFQFENLPPQTEYTVTLLGKGPGLLSRFHKLVISTGPEPPTDIVFSQVTDASLTVSWTKPNSSVSGFKVTYTHADEGEPVSVSVDSAASTFDLSRLSPGSSYEVSVISVLGLDESDPIKDVVGTLPDPPTDLRAVNVTDTKALLLWRPALATIDKYTIVYGSGTDSDVRVTVSGNAAEHQLSGLKGSTTYTVTITSQQGGRESSPATATFTTAGGSGGDGGRDGGGGGLGHLQASNVTPRTALLSWKPPPNPVGSYRLTYQTEGQEMKEVIMDATVMEYNLTRLHPGSRYTATLQAAGGGPDASAIAATEFTTGSLRFPFPTDCSQELLNGIRVSDEVEIYPQGRLGTPVMVYCDMETDGGGWTVFQRRKDGSVNFFRGWKEYVKGFGDLSGEFWLGLESLHNLTTMTKMSLRVDLRDKDESVFAKYSTFEVAKKSYKLTVGGYSGTAGDSLSYHSNQFFSTKDRDPSPFITRCAMSYRGGWWYKNCHLANLNGLYGIDVKHQGVIWTSWKGNDFSIEFTEMKMRPAAFSPPA